MSTIIWTMKHWFEQIALTLLLCATVLMLVWFSGSINDFRSRQGELKANQVKIEADVLQNSISNDRGRAERRVFQDKVLSLLCEGVDQVGGETAAECVGVGRP